MPGPLDVVILFAVGLVAGTMNVMAGGGSTLTLPALLFMGLDGATANGTNRVAILLQNIFAVESFRRRKMSRLRESAALGLVTLPGAILGALFALRVGDLWFQRILGLVMIGVVASMLLPRPTRREATDAPARSPWIYPALFGIGFYGGFIQVGVGFLIMAALYHLLRLDLVRVNMHKVAIVLIYTIPAILVFAWSGNVDWPLGLSLAAGNALGGWWAAHFSVKGGERILRPVMIVAVLVIALRLLGAY